MSIVGRRSTLILSVGLLGVVVVLLVAMYLYDHGRREDLAHGVTIGGVDVGGMRASAARAKIERDLIAPLNQPVTIRSGTHTWQISGREAGLTVDATSTVDRAVAASRRGSIVSRTFRGLFGGSVNSNIPVEVGYSHQAVRTLTAQVRAAVNVQPRDASVKPSASGLQEVASRPGMAVNSPLLGSRVEQALTGAVKSHTVMVPTKQVIPAVTTSQLAAKYPTYIVVDRSGFTLRFYEHLKLALSYPIAVGMQGLETPPGLYAVQYKEVNPPWIVPHSAWTGSLAGKTIPPGPEDPLKARLMAFDGSAAIHGIDPSEYSSIGHTASHGCVRMTIPDVIALYKRTPVGTPVFIA
jgi:lipoprotein-anchoring transpeptidase ErfK/SrfK